MATSAIGPGFITQTTNFTIQMGAAFSAAILISIIVDIAVQLNVWRVIGVSGLRANTLGNRVLPGLGWALGIMVALGGLVFNIGNIAGGGLGMNAMLGLDAKIGGLITAGIAIIIFLWRAAGKAMDTVVVFLGIVMIALMLYVAFISGPPVGEVLKQTVLPDAFDFFVVTTLIGGTVGGYITYSGAHRMVDTGITGVKNVGRISRSSVLGIITTGIMRYLLFLAILGVVVAGANLADSTNQAADAFQFAAGEVGLRLFGIILWGAAITSVIGAAFTSVSFITPQTTPVKTRNYVTVGFIVFSAIVYWFLGQAPQTILIVAGTVNGLILPIGFTLILWVAWRRRDLMDGYKYPGWLLGIGVVSWLLTIYLGYNALGGIARLWTGG
ncbi:MAG: divalent metal cation transporter [bacterium]|nr:divalent metal cation transporter [bacterium]